MVRTLLVYLKDTKVVSREVAIEKIIKKRQISDRKREQQLENF